MQHRPRIFVDYDRLEHEQYVRVTNQHDTHHLIRVMRCKITDLVECVTINGVAWECRIHEIQRSLIIVIVMNQISQLSSQIKPSLAFALVRPNRTALIIEKCTEVGITDFYPLITERTQIDTKHINFDRLHTVAKSAAQQSRQLHIPTIHAPKYLHQLAIDNSCAICCTSAQSTNRLSSAEITTALVGPEGGFTEEEEQYCIANGAIAASLGISILRTETAAIIAAYQIVNNNTPTHLQPIAQD